jgi:hypothetical protein
LIANAPHIVAQQYLLIIDLVDERDCNIARVHDAWLVRGKPRRSDAAERGRYADANPLTFLDQVDRSLEESAVKNGQGAGDDWPRDHQDARPRQADRAGVAHKNGNRSCGFSRTRNADLGRFTVERLMTIINLLGWI